jgi:ATP-dependent helicase/nuclease subunit A
MIFLFSVLSNQIIVKEGPPSQTVFEDLTFQQFCALDHQRNMVITAGPGAGKTRILSHRFCFILLIDDSVALPQILSLTFTEKAAEEMKSRIYEIISRIEKDLYIRGIEEKGLQNKIKEVRERFHKNRISTIHSFCASLLREHPVESGIDPGFSVIQGIRQRKIMDEAIETSVARVWQQDRHHLFPLMQSFGNRRNLLRAIGHIIDHPLKVKSVEACSRRLFHTKDWKGKVFREYCRIIKEENLIPYLEGLRKIRGGKTPLNKVHALLEEWAGQLESDESSKDFGIPDLFRNLRQMSEGRKSGAPRLAVKKGLKEISYANLVEMFYPDIFSSLSADRIFQDQLQSFLMVAQACLNRYEREKRRINVLDFADLETLSHSFLRGLFESEDQRGLKHVQDRFKYIMVDEFQDTNRVQWEIISLLCSDRARDGKRLLQPGKLFVVGDKRQAIYRFRGGDVTVFEYGTQRILQSNQGGPDRMFWEIPEIDARLRIIEPDYPELHKRQTAAFETLFHSERRKILMGDIYLPHNFRTDSRPIEFMNSTFDQIFSCKGAKELHEYETAPRVISMPENGASKSKGSTTCYLIRDSLSRKDRVAREATLVADIIESLLGKNGDERIEFEKYADIREKIEKNQLSIGILFFSFTHLRVFENVLREAGLPFKVHRGRGFYRCQEVMEMIQLLQYLCDERQQISLLATLRSPIFGLTDSEIFDLFYGKDPTLEQFLSSENAYVKSVGEQIKSWRLLSDRLTPAELIRTIISDRALTAVHSVHPDGMQRLANMEKLIELSRSFQMDGIGSLAEFVQYCLEMAEEGEEEEGEALIMSQGESPICLMTIHAAKGLEFPMVIIPDLNRLPPSKIQLGKPCRLYASKNRKPGDWNQKEGEIPLWPIEIPEMDYRKNYTPLGYLLGRRNRLEDMAENRRVFYVGCTRTMNHLVLIGHRGKRDSEKERAHLSTEDYRERATIMDLLDDIYEFDTNSSSEYSECFDGREGNPSILWSDPKPRDFQGIPYGSVTSTQRHFCHYSEAVKKLDLSESIRTPSYYQFSFKSLRIFRKCPRMFYYNVMLGIRENTLTPSKPLANIAGIPPRVIKGDDEWDVKIAEDALFIGNVIHHYLERHRFGDPLDKDLLHRICGRLAETDLSEELSCIETKATLERRVFKHLERTVKDASLLKLLGGEHEYAEVPFLFSISHGCEFRGTIDRLFREKETGRWMILDWKSNALGGKDPILVAEEHDYNLQLATYKWAVERMLKEVVGDLFIYFTDTGQLIRSQWKGRPEDVIEEMLLWSQQDEADRRLLKQGLGDIEGNPKECPHCEYRGVFCVGEDS